MATKNLKYFMREESKQEQVFNVPAPARFTDEKGEVVQMPCILWWKIQREIAIIKSMI